MANPIHDAFASIHADDSLKTSTKEFLRQSRQRRTQPILPHFRQLRAAVCAVFLLLLGAIGFHTVSNTPVSYISIDVNPSIELTLNRWNQVITAEACNEDGSAILSTLSVKGMAYTDAVDAIVGSEAMQPYLEKDNTLTFTVASSDEERETVLLAGIEMSSGCRDHNGESYSGNPSHLEEAHAHGLSLGKYTAYLEISRYDASVTPEDCREMTMAQIHSHISECQNAAHESGSQDSSQNGHGSNNTSQNQDGQHSQGQSGGQWGNGNHNNHNDHH